MTLKSPGPFVHNPAITKDFKIFCFEGLEKKWAYLWCNPVVSNYSVQCTCGTLHTIMSVVVTSSASYLGYYQQHDILIELPPIKIQLSFCTALSVY